MDRLREVTAVLGEGSPDPQGIQRSEWGAGAGGVRRRLLTPGRGALAVISPGWTELAVTTKNAAIGVGEERP